MNSAIRARIDTHALQHNLNLLRAAAPGSRVLAVIKANAYGHGLQLVAQALQHADGFAVARLEEAVLLRQSGVRLPITLLEGVADVEQLAEAAAHDLDLVVHDTSQLDLLEAWRGPHRFTIWLKIDTGMNRLGFRVEQAPWALERLAALRFPARELRWLTHLACADELDPTATSHQLQRFRVALASLPSAAHPVISSIANSAAILGWPAAHGGWIRPGLALYGVSPFPGRVGADLGLRPAMTLESNVIAVRRVPRGESVGYGGAWTAARDSTVAILAGGYADGLPRHLPNGTRIRLGGHHLSLVGRVSMDMLAVDITEAPEVRVGAVAQLWGAEAPVEQVAHQAGTIAYELLCRVPGRVPRIPSPPA